MKATDGLYGWNAWFDSATPQFRFDLAIWGFVALGLLNLLLTFAFGMTFGLLLFLGLVVLNLLRLPYRLGDLPVPSAATPPAGTRRVEAWIGRINAAPADLISLPNLGIALAATMTIGALGLLTSRYGLPFGLLFLLALVNTRVAIRGQVARPADATPLATPAPLAIGQDRHLALEADPRREPSTI